MDKAFGKIDQKRKKERKRQKMSGIKGDITIDVRENKKKK